MPDAKTGRASNQDVSCGVVGCFSHARRGEGLLGGLHLLRYIAGWTKIGRIFTAMPRKSE